MFGLRAVAASWPRLARVDTWQWVSLASVVALVVMAIGELRSGAVPVGDNAMIEVRARDVLSRHPPLVNMLSTVASDGSVRHPGPLLFDLLAIPVRLARHGRGLLIGVAIIHIAVVWTIGRTARRFLGRGGATLAAAATAVLVWTLGRELLLEPWQPHVTLPACLLLLLAAWGIASGCDRCAPAAAFAFSFVLQTHASYLVLAAAVVLAALALRLTLARRERLDRRPVLVSGVLVVVLWAQPVIQQLFGSGRGNLGAVLDVATSGDEDVLGVGEALRVSMTVLARPPFWLRPGIVSQLPIAEGALAERLGLTSDRPSSTVTALLLVGVLVGLAALLVVGRRRADRVVVAGASVAFTALVSGIAFIARLPVDPIFGFMVHKVRWLWPLGAFLTLVAGVAALRWIQSRWARRAEFGLAAISVLSLLAAVASDRSDVSLHSKFAGLVSSAADIRESLGPVEQLGVVYVPIEHETVLAAFFDTSIVAELVERRVPVRLTVPVGIAQYGDQYELVDAADMTLRVSVGPLPPAADEQMVLFEGQVDLDEALLGELVPGAVGQDVMVRVTIEPFEPSDASSARP